MTELHEGRVEGEPLRGLVLALLDEILMPVRQVELTAIMTARHGCGVSALEFSDLLESDQRRFRAAQGTVEPAEILLLPALVAGDGWADGQCLTRSDWALRMRLVGSALEHERRVSMVRALCDQLLMAQQEGRGDPGPLREMIVASAGLFPEGWLEKYSAEASPGADPMNVYRHGAEDYSGRLLQEQRALVAELESRLSGLAPDEFLFGISRGKGSEPSSSEGHG